ncbi:hypothetical protein QFZ74_002873 [Streptomyces sp. V3I7]|nr:hypothetical protein [Streptomyces sp. V3I7]
MVRSRARIRDGDGTATPRHGNAEAGEEGWGVASDTLHVVQQLKLSRSKAVAAVFDTVGRGPSRT